MANERRCPRHRPRRLRPLHRRVSAARDRNDRKEVSVAAQQRPIVHPTDRKDLRAPFVAPRADGLNAPALLARLQLRKRSIPRPPTHGVAEDPLVMPRAAASIPKVEEAEGSSAITSRRPRRFHLNSALRAEWTSRATVAS